MNTNHTNDVEVAYNNKSNKTLITFNTNFPSKVTLSDTDFYEQAFSLTIYCGNNITYQ